MNTNPSFIKLIKFDLGNVTINLPRSKSISNRALLINTLSTSNCNLLGLSEARDTKIMSSQIKSDDYTIDIKDAGTAMRFLTAYYAIGASEKEIPAQRGCRRDPLTY